MRPRQSLYQNQLTGKAAAASLTWYRDIDRTASPIGGRHLWIKYRREGRQQNIYRERDNRERISDIYIMILLSVLFLSTSTVTVAAAVAAETSSTAAVIFITLDPSGVVVSLSYSRWDKSNDAKYEEKEKK